MLHRVLCLTLLFAAPAAGLAQQLTNNWAGMETLKPGTSIRITLHKQKILCSFDSADGDELICHRRLAGVDRSLSFDKTDIQLIRTRNVTASVIGGALIGGGIGAGVGAIVDSGIKNPNTTNNAKFTGGLGRAGGLLGGLLGLATEFAPGKLLYKRDVEHP